jgi:hypothetical protein
MINSDEQNQNLKQLFSRLAKSKFRSGFKLREKELLYLQNKGFAVIEQHARDFVKQRLVPALPENDGRQTPMRNHPVFIAQHATGTCCRKCTEKWHGIKMGQELTEKQVDYIVSVIMYWLKKLDIRHKT